jgi:uncharacterized protein YciI
MKYYALFYEAVDDMVSRRAPFRAEHLQLVRDAHARGEIVLAGAIGDPPDGALIVFRGESPAAAEAFAAIDPYVTRGVVTRWRVVPWHVVVGQEA